MMKNGGNAMLIECFKDHPGQPLEAPKDQDRKKKGGGKTVSSYFKGQLDDLMTTLYKTEPHFIRCVVPNTHKIPGGVEPDLVMTSINVTESWLALPFAEQDSRIRWSTQNSNL